MTEMMRKIEQIACPRNVPNSHPILTKLFLLFAKVWKASYWRLKTSLGVSMSDSQIGNICFVSCVS